MTTLARIQSTKAKTKLLLNHEGGDQFHLWTEIDGEFHESTGVASAIAAELDELVDEPSPTQLKMIGILKDELSVCCRNEGIPCAYLGV